MDVKHDVSDDERRPDRAEAALQERQKKEDAETLRVRGPQRPADSVAAADTAGAEATPKPEPRAVTPTTVRPATVRPAGTTKAVAPGSAQPVTERTAEKPSDTDGPPEFKSR